jgi:hypothetical protein
MLSGHVERELQTGAYNERGVSTGLSERLRRHLFGSARGIYWAQNPGATAHENGVHMSGISGDPDTPRRHYRLRLPQRLAPAEAEKIYGIVGGALACGYQWVRENAGEGYQQWRRYNRSPYL